MIYDIKAIPTEYGGVNFRSRLEARWACFFDLMGWRWSYEPLDFDGWIPDFVLHGRDEKIFVEVKPLFGPDPALFRELNRHSRESRLTILALGVEPAPVASTFSTSARLGWLIEPTVVAGSYLHKHESVWGFNSTAYPYLDVINAREWPDYRSQKSWDEAQALWREAGNTVQWRVAA